ncbi:MAG: hypothetical protein QXX55_01735 [Candidatus Pacearchaeota archaeon]
MLKKFLKDAVNIIVGKQVENIVDLFDTPKYVNEFIIAKKLGITINQTRNILYKLAHFGLISSIRKKDRRKGWYTYFWRIEILKSLEFVRNDIIKKIESLEHQIKIRETKRFYSCDRCHIELNEENALLHNFTCPECGSVLTIKDNTKLIKEMKKNIDKMKKDLLLLDEEIKKENKKFESKMIKEINKERRKKEKNKKYSKKKKSKSKKIKKNPKNRKR